MLLILANSLLRLRCRIPLPSLLWRSGEKLAIPVGTLFLPIQIIFLPPLHTHSSLIDRLFCLRKVCDSAVEKVCM